MTGGAGLAQALVDTRIQFFVERLITRNDQVGGNQGTGLAGKDAADALNDRADGDDRTDADRETNKEEQQPPPRSAHLADCHRDDELHRLAPTAAVVRSPTGRPSR